MEPSERIQSIPKTELHQHVDGSIPADVTWELMHHYQLNPVDSLDEMRQHLEIQETEEGTLLAYLDKMHYPLWVTQFYEYVSKVVEEIALAAAATGLPILPVAIAASRAKLLPSWDRMLLPLPGSRVEVVYGEPILVPRDGAIEEWALRLEGVLNETEARAERWARGEEVGT